jgi:prepilin-type N-terminal cleavage/methylation domain-containing protein
MEIPRRLKGFTLIELLVVVAIIALLLSILLPSLSGAREQGKKAKCLANLKSVGTAICQYASEDRVEQIIPIMPQMVNNMAHWGGGGTVDGGLWLWRTANWFCWGGRSGQKVFKTSFDLGYSLADVPALDATGEDSLRVDYAADRRPLNKYMVNGISAGDQKRMDWFACPSDKGYPDDPRIDDAPAANCLRSCYDTLGNSYRGSLSCYVSTNGGGLASATRAFSLGPWGHRASTLPEQGRLVLAGEPTFFNMIGRDDGGDKQEVAVLGWHNRKMMDDLLYCDGSARLTKAETPLPISEEIRPQIDADIFRATTFRLDIFPTGGAIIFGSWTDDINQNPDKWPWRNFQDNLKSTD